VERIRKSKVRSDSSATYDVVTDAKTVREFIHQILTEFDDEWGCIGVASQYIFGEPRCEYRYGQIVGGALPDMVLDASLKSVLAFGGWSNMDYVLRLNRHPEPLSSGDAS
jgi:hypothetical protein